MADIEIYVAESDVKLQSGQAIGFFGEAGFGDPISLNSFNGRTFVTNLTGSTNGPEADNCKLIANVPAWNGPDGPSGVIVGQTGSGIGILNLPNYLATMNVRFTNVSTVVVQDASLIVHDGGGVNDPSGLNVYMAEIVHFSRSQADLGTGDFRWAKITPLSGLLLSNSPGISGSFPIGGSDIRHDWYVACSTQPILPNDRIFYMTVALIYL